MVRVFGLLVAAIALMAPANAALLTYSFNGTVAGSVDASAGGATAGDFTQATGTGSLQGGTSYRTAAPGTNTFELTIGAVPLKLSDLSIRGKKTNTTGGTTSSGALINVFYQIDTGAGYGASTPVDNFGPTNNFGTSSLGLGDILLLTDNKIKFTIDTAVSTGSSVSYEMDWIELSGASVPEPASMAIFGLMGAGLAVRRFRRK